MIISVGITSLEFIQYALALFNFAIMLFNMHCANESFQAKRWGFFAFNGSAALLGLLMMFWVLGFIQIAWSQS